MKINVRTGRKVRIEMLPLIDIVFLLLVFFIYAMLSMAVHRGLPVVLPTSSSAKIDKELVLSVTVKSDRTIYVDKERVAFDLFADRSLPYQKLFQVLDQIRMAGIHRISLQAEAEQAK
ncbi:MAG: biopolymer transporter ExbD [Deltaproteobacteria bacterium]|nr:biopolymer transporter ExbD [Deltaproteobacteria bacterium]